MLCVIFTKIYICTSLMVSRLGSKNCVQKFKLRGSPRLLASGQTLGMLPSLLFSEPPRGGMLYRLTG